MLKPILTLGIIPRLFESRTNSLPKIAHLESMQDTSSGIIEVYGRFNLHDRLQKLC